VERNGDRIFEARRTIREEARPGEWEGSVADVPEEELREAMEDYATTGGDPYTAPCPACGEGILVYIGAFYGTEKYDPYIHRACPLCGFNEEHPWDPEKKPGGSGSRDDDRGSSIWSQMKRWGPF
jgi:hypothetical protein